MSTEAFARGLADRYRIERELGRGGMATVFLADDLKHGRKVAIKVMQPQLAAEIGQDRFLREIEIAARLTHPHILPLFDSGAIEGQVFYVMPYIEGESLRTLLDREKQLGLDEALRLTREVASGLGHAHHHGLVHRDVKPENLLLADGMALIADFGVARTVRGAAASPSDATAPLHTDAGAVIGTPRYMAPEQAKGEDVDGRSDIYALGCVLYEMLAGTPPFTAATHEALLRMQMLSEPRPVTEFRPNVPPAIAAAVARALQKPPGDRFPTMAQFAEALVMSGGATPTPAAEVQHTATPNNLPKERSRFIGREKELAECARILAETRMLTLTGVGGSGKTRLGLRLAESMLDSYPDGVWFVDLAPVESDALVPQVVVSTLGITPDGDESDGAAIVRHLSGKRSLLILDNTEHLLDPSADLADRLLAGLPDLKMLVTSREGLGIEGERLFAVRSLRLPPEDAEPDPQTLLGFEAVRLFVTRAQEADRKFALDAGNARTVVDVCRRLDGIPLALELAAARVRALSVERIASMLDDRFRLLTGGSRSVQRHRTLRATVQWSYDHLEPEEQEFFTTLSVFSGGWTLEAAAHIAEADEFQALDLLTRLIDKSLVMMERTPSGDTRYRMLETLRQFGLELLTTQGRAEAVRARHLDYFSNWVESMREALRKYYAPDEIRRLKGDMDNLRAALTWGFQEQPVPATEITKVLYPLWDEAGFYAEGRRWYQRILDRGDAVEPAERAHVLGRSGRLAFKQGDYAVHLAYQEERSRIFEELGDDKRLARSFVLQGTTHAYLGNPEKAFPLLEQARIVYEALGEASLIGRLETSVGLASYLVGDYDEARHRFELSLVQAEKDGIDNRVQTAIGNLALVDIMQSRPADAKRRIRQCMEINHKVANLYGISHDLPALAEATRQEGDPSGAARWIGACDALLEKIDAKLEGLEQDTYDRASAAAREALGDEAFEAVRAEGRQLSWENIVEQA